MEIRRIKLFKNILVLVQLLFLSISCNDKSQQVGANQEITTEFTEVFESVGFSISTPCELRDVSSQSQGDFLINYGGVENPNNQETMAAYQVVVSRIPVGYRDVPKDQLDTYLEGILENTISKFSNVEKIKFGYEDYPGYVCYTLHNGLKQKAVIFIKGEYIICLTLITNKDIESRFNRFTNGFKTISQSQLSLPTVERKIKVNAELPKHFSNSKFSISYPKEWDIVQEDVRMTKRTTIAVQVMNQNVQDYEFAPNVNVIVSSEKYVESTYSLAQNGFQQLKDAGFASKLISITDCNLNGCRGSVAEYTAVIQNFTLRMWQYVVKKPDNTTFYITATIDNATDSSQRPVVREIVNSFYAK